MEYLTSWKEIANYLHSGVRTVQRYESDSGFPVHRLAGKRRGSVRTTTTEIDAWMLTVSNQQNFKSHPKVVVGGESEKLSQGIRRMIELQKQSEFLQREHSSARTQLAEQLAKLRFAIAAQPFIPECMQSLLMRPEGCAE